jgi:hypothetical protein
MDTTKKENTDTLIDVNNEVGVEAIADKAKYMLLPCHQNAGQNHDLKTGYRSLENLAQFKCLGMAVIYQNLI